MANLKKPFNSLRKKDKVKHQQEKSKNSLEISLMGIMSRSRQGGNPFLRRNRSIVLKPYKYNRYKPHQGELEKQRRRQQMGIKDTYNG